jgi:hypothetical protein
MFPAFAVSAVYVLRSGRLCSNKRAPLFTRIKAGQGLRRTEPDRQCTYSVALRRVCATTVAVEKQ